MLTNKHLLQEIREIESVASNVKKENVLHWAVLKIGILLVKLVHNLRTNTVAVMRHQGIDLVKPTRRQEDDGKTETQE